MSRKERLGEEIFDVLAPLFTGQRLSDPRIQQVTLTYVKLTGDLQLAYVYFRLYDESLKKEALKGLESCKGFLRKNLAQALDVRKVPELKFFYDDSIEEGSKIEALLATIKAEEN